MSTSLLLFGVLFSSIGLGYCLYGRRQRAGVPLACGVALMVVPYFMWSAAMLFIIGIVLSAIPWFARL